MDNRILCTPRCLVRELTEEDVAAEFQLYDSPHMTDHIPALSDYDTEVKLCREYEDRVYRCFGYGMWGVFDRNTGRLIGEAGLEPRADTDRTKYPYDWMFDRNCTELGFCIAEELWGQGYCTEVCTRILDYCLEHFGITTVFARTVPANIASIRVLERLGFAVYERTEDGNGGVTMIYRKDGFT